MGEEMAKEGNCVAPILESLETTCWGCGLRLILSSYSPIFKCGWCGAVTNQNQISRKPDSQCFSRWRRVRDGLFVSILLLFILFVISAGVWAVYPIIFSISYVCGVFHCTLTATLSICTISSFSLAAFQSAGTPASVLWGSYPNVVKGGLEDYTFCTYCEKPKSPRTHHCRTCRACVLDMDHHCPFIGNCVGAANHRSFIAFLIIVVISCTYVAAMTVYASLHVWPPLRYRHLGSSIPLNNLGATAVVRDILAAFASSASQLSARGIVLIYLAIASMSVEIGISALLYQQLQFIYQGKTYINHISWQNGVHEERSYQNILRFFNCPYWVFRLLPRSPNAGRLQDSSKLL